MAILGMNHFTVLSGNLDATLAFYGDVLGLHSGRRPPFDFPGAWLYSGDTAPLHVVAGRPLPTEPAGVIDHMAFTASDLKAVKARFDAAGLKYDLRQQAGAGTWQLFSFDPNGARVELDFDPAETP